MDARTQHLHATRAHKNKKKYITTWQCPTVYSHFVFVCKQNLIRNVRNACSHYNYRLEEIHMKVKCVIVCVCVNVSVAGTSVRALIVFSSNCCCCNRWLWLMWKRKKYIFSFCMCGAHTSGRTFVHRRAYIYWHICRMNDARILCTTVSVVSNGWATGKYVRFSHNFSSRSRLRMGERIDNNYAAVGQMWEPMCSLAIRKNTVCTFHWNVRSAVRSPHP